MNMNINPAVTITIAAERTNGFLAEAEVRRIRRRARLSRRASGLAQSDLRPQAAFDASPAAPARWRARRRALATLDITTALLSCPSEQDAPVPLPASGEREHASACVA